MLQVVSGSERQDGWIDVVDPTPAEIALLERDYAITDWGATYSHAAPSPMKRGRLAVAVRC